MLYNCLSKVSNSIPTHEARVPYVCDSQCAYIGVCIYEM